MNKTVFYGCRITVNCIGRPVVPITHTPSHAGGAGAPPLPFVTSCIPFAVAENLTVYFFLLSVFYGSACLVILPKTVVCEKILSI